MPTTAGQFTNSCAGNTRSMQQANKEKKRVYKHFPSFFKKRFKNMLRPTRLRTMDDSYSISI